MARTRAARSRTDPNAGRQPPSQFPRNPTINGTRVTALIVDDEPVARAGLRDMLGQVEWLTIVGEAADGKSALEMIDRLKPELVFLDIEMPGIIGTDIIGRTKHQPFVVFTTAYAQHAAAAFELGALDYVLKPFGSDRLEKTLERVRSALGEPSSPPALDRLREAFGTGPMSRLFVRSGNGVIPVLVSDVIRFEASGDYVTAHTARSRHMLHLSLNRLESRLDPKRFIRVHRTHIVNLDHVVAFRRQARGLVAELEGGVRVPVSREKAKEIRSLGL
ncbi:MAG TPA: LytTR family DNA-binding domain-containing protein [Gemmatimonadaceae bacterium]|nr:LytTR family DNA-binding domain-containing protein [Gemmatimonadaceae bacterium]